MRPRLLIVDPDVDSRAAISSLLGRFDLEVLEAASAREMDQILGRTQIELVVMDILPPDEAGLSVCARLRRLNPAPGVVVVSAVDDESDVVVGLEMGVDDYIAKPFRPRETAARIRAAVRRRQAWRAPEPVAAPPVYQFSGWRLNVATHELFDPRGESVNLSSAEFLVLWTLVAKPQQILTRDQLQQGPPEARSKAPPQQINVTISRLRSKLRRSEGGAQMVRTVRHAGYMFAPRVDRVHAD